ncbi:FAA hydrolase family protein [Brevibacterium permense]|uniref:fumarylacetoacetate hydrolase family protein n=1 Tax=Brevibacterium permense TaxID=234834 RepID=UPI0021D1A349|nr:fumarylacetoacetate hydrolase family protein [Brevibacterium permense]MCU4298831.1 FAA hydrolase family protein [Brevibacterium permense]
MKIVSYRNQSGTRGGILFNGEVFDLEELLNETPEATRGACNSVTDLLNHYGDDLTSLSNAVSQTLLRSPSSRVGSLDDVYLDGPVVGPSKVLCVGLNYKDHVAETGRALPEYPDIFAKFASTLIGPADEIGGRNVTDNLDFEGELAVVIGRAAAHVFEDEALEYVAGLTVLNDITARDLQYRGTQWLPGKAVDGSTPWGPALVTLDDISDPQSLALVTRINGVEYQRSNTRHQIFSIAQIVSYLSGFLTLNPGDVIATGTPQGIGAKRNPPVWLDSGDVVEIDIEEVGILRNTVARR